MCDKLKTILPKLKGYNIKVGSGISFFYCGKCTTTIKDTIEKISNDYYNELIKYKEKTQDKIKNLDSHYENKRESAKKKYKRNKKKLAALLTELEKQKANDKVLLPKRVWSYTQQIIKWTPLLERKVLYVVDGISPDEPNTKIIKVNGKEKGKFWTIAEYKGTTPYKRHSVFNDMTPQIKKDIYKDTISGKYFAYEIEKKYGVSKSVIQKVLKEQRDKIILKKGYKTIGELK